jgi:hypothetical protein
VVLGRRARITDQRRCRPVRRWRARRGARHRPGSSHSTRPSPRAWAWASRSAARSSKPMADGCGRSRANHTVLSFRLRSPLTEPPSVIDVAYWHKCEVPTASSNVRVREQNGRHMLAASFSQFDLEQTSSAFIWAEVVALRSGEEGQIGPVSPSVR